MKSLAITTSTASVGVAVGDASTVLGYRQELTDRRHAEELTPMIEGVLAEASVGLGAIDQLIVDIGPGRFTGLRVGLATVKTLALLLDRKVVPLTSLEILAAAEEAPSVLAVVDARRGEVFQQYFQRGGAADAPHVGPPEELLPPLENLLAVGDGVDRYSELYAESGQLDRQVRADVMLKLADKKPAIPGTRVLPLYLREPDAIPNVKTRQTPPAG